MRPRLLVLCLFIFCMGHCPAASVLAKNPLRPAIAAEQTRAQFIARRDGLFKEAVSFAATDQFQKAVASAEAALDVQQQHLGNQTAEACLILEYIAAGKELQADYPGAMATWTELEALSDKVRGRDHWATVGVRLAAASCQRAAKLNAEDQQRLAKAAQLSMRSEQLFAAGKYAEARQRATSSLETREALLGPEDAITAASLHNAGVAYLAIGDAKTARSFLQRCVAIRKRLYGVKSPGTLASLTNLWGVYNALGETKLVRPILEDILTGSTGVYGPRHPATLRALFQLGNFDLEQGDLSQAEPTLLLVVKLQRASYGPKHLEIAQTLARLGMLYLKKPDLAQADRCFRQSLGMYQQLLGEDHPDTARALVRLANCEYVAKNHSQAQQHLTKALHILPRTVGEAHPDTLEAMHTLARVLPPLGEYAQAERLYRKVLKLYGQSSGNDIQIATALLELGILYGGWNDIGNAERCLKQSLRLSRRILGDAHQDTAAVWVALAIVDARSGHLDRAEKTCHEALSVTQQVLGPNHTQTGAISAVLGGVLFLQGRYDEAELVFQRLLSSRPAKTSEDRYHNGIIVEKLALIALKKGDYAKAISRADGAMQAYGETLPALHPHWADIAVVAGIAHLALNHQDEAKQLADRAIDVARRQLDATSMAQSERQQLALTLRLREILDLELSLPEQKTTASEAYRHVLMWKGAIQARQIRGRQQREGEAERMATGLRQVCMQLATLSLRVPDPSERAAWLEQVDELKVRKESLEADMASHSRDFRAQRETGAVTAEKLQSVLPPGTVLVDVLEYICFSATKDKSTPDEDRYAAFVVRRDQPVARIDLGPARIINDAVEHWRLHCLYGKQKSKEDHGVLLRKLIWEPLQSHLAGCDTVLFSPDSILSRLPLGALPGQRPESYLIEDVAIGTVPVPQMLPELLNVSQAHAPRLPRFSPAMLVVGDVDYDAAPAQADESDLNQLSKESLGGELLTFERLQSAPAEIQALRGLYYRRFPVGKLSVLDNAKATEAAFRREAPGHSWLLVVTHGFFAPPNVVSALAVQDELAGLDANHGREHSGALSGLALAGANFPPTPDGDDGILTAYEVATLDLRNVELAVLSGCETGLGKNFFGEGSMGMQRAFQVAGARTTVASLWNVPDASTSELMQRFYANLWDRKMSKLEALREAQLWIMRTGRTEQEVNKSSETARKRRPPYFWAAFVLSGDWR